MKIKKSSRTFSLFSIHFRTHQEEERIEDGKKLRKRLNPGGTPTDKNQFEKAKSATMPIKADNAIGTALSRMNLKKPGSAGRLACIQLLRVPFFIF